MIPSTIGAFEGCVMAPLWGQILQPLAALTLQRFLQSCQAHCPFSSLSISSLPHSLTKPIGTVLPEIMVPSNPPLFST
jgi:hypothetical protein